MPTIKLTDMERYAFADLAAGKDARGSKKRNARQCIVLGARDWLDRWFFPYIWAGRLTTSQFKEKILSVQEKYEPRRFGLEANGMQVLFGNLVREEAIDKFGNGIKMLPIYQPTSVEKNYRIRTGFEPPLLQGRIFLRESEVEARSEIQGFPTAQTKDIIDAMETVINRVAPKRPINTQKSREEIEYAGYLRATGMPGHLIKQEMKKFKQKRMQTVH